MTEQLSCHVHNFVMIGKLGTESYHHVASTESELWIRAYECHGTFAILPVSGPFY